MQLSCSPDLIALTTFTKQWSELVAWLCRHPLPVWGWTMTALPSDKALISSLSLLSRLSASLRQPLSNVTPVFFSSSSPCCFLGFQSFPLCSRLHWLHSRPTTYYTTPFSSRGDIIVSWIPCLLFPCFTLFGWSVGPQAALSLSKMREKWTSST